MTFNITADVIELSKLSAVTGKDRGREGRREEERENKDEGRERAREGAEQTTHTQKSRVKWLAYCMYSVLHSLTFLLAKS